MNPYRTMQQLATSVGVSRRLMFQALAVHRFGCPELVKAAHSGLLAMKHCETLALAMPRDEQRDLLAKLTSMTSRQRHDLLAILAGDLKARKLQLKKRGC